MEIVLALLTGMGLSISAGFNLFVPLLVMSILARNGMVPVPEELPWLSSDIAFWILLVACVVEFITYLVPFISTAWSAISIPLGVIEGMYLVAVMLPPDISPPVVWALMIMAGGVPAGGTELVSFGGQAAADVTTGGLATPPLSLLQIVLAVITAMLALLIPVIVVVVTFVLIIYATKSIIRRRRPAVAR